MARKNNNQELEPYKPDYSPDLSGSQNNQRGGGGFFGCLQNSIAITLFSALVITLIIATVYFLSLREVGNTTSNIFDSVSRLFGGGDNVTTVDVRQFILTVQQEAWLETARELQNVDIQAKNDWPGILPGQRSLRYSALVTVTAGVDLQLMDENSFVVDGDTVTVTLPPPQIKDCILDEDNSRYYDRNCSAVGVVDVGCGGLEDVLRQTAVETAATENVEPLMEDAFNFAAEQIQNMGSNMGFTTVNIVRSPVDVSQVASDGTCIPPEATEPDTPVENRRRRRRTRGVNPPHPVNTIETLTRDFNLLPRWGCNGLKPIVSDSYGNREYSAGNWRIPINPDHKRWTPETDMTRYTDPSHPDFWQPDRVKEDS